MRRPFSYATAPKKKATFLATGLAACAVPAEHFCLTFRCCLSRESSGFLESRFIRDREEGKGFETHENPTASELPNLGNHLINAIGRGQLASFLTQTHASRVGCYLCVEPAFIGP